MPWGWLGEHETTDMLSRLCLPSTHREKLEIPRDGGRGEGSASSHQTLARQTPRRGGGCEVWLWARWEGGWAYPHMCRSRGEAVPGAEAVGRQCV